ncbi:type III polyketide synthase [Pueribacillus theae]|uniref:Type III polyketide synthase n=1 Tax=Pueribacillus theae TaxID=2171751 RepID=A0A2U1K615_9BACI|nr:3-oxoacyl-[acyl-carrier-protein] synthase III C-terminal domain-containing protein [Pueribacillus theae]PWA12413.1 type III polyketide synthase [Pueribacillus theae]
MPYILSVGTESPPHYFSQEEVKNFVRELFHSQFRNIDRLLNIFHNGQIEGRYFSAPLEWFQKEHTFSEKNNLYIELAVELGVKAIEKALHNVNFFAKPVPFKEIDAIFFISSSGISTPSIDALIMNKLPFSNHLKRIPIWGLGCAGGAAGISRAFEYCTAFPEANVLILSVELCSLTFQKGDLTKSNLIGTSLFADGVACGLVCGDESTLLSTSRLRNSPYILGNSSAFMPESEDVMGWEIKNTGLHVIFSKDIPQIIEGWLKPNVVEFLEKYDLSIHQVQHFVAHPGGRKVLEAYERTLNLSEDKLSISADVLKKYGNMSSATILYVLQQFLLQNLDEYDIGLLMALGPGFSSETVLLEWRKPEVKEKGKQNHAV